MSTPPEWLSADDDDDEQQHGGGKTETLQDVRKFARRRDREAKKLEAELAELREFKTTYDSEKLEGTLSKAFQEAKLDPDHAKLFKAMNPEITADAITSDAILSFAAEYKLPTVEGEAVQTPEKPEQGFTPVTTGQAPPLKEYDHEEIKSLMAQGKYDEVNAAYAAGRVKKEVAPWTQPT